MKRDVYEVLSKIKDMKDLSHFKILIENIYSCIQFGKRWEQEVGVPTSIESGGGVFSRSEIRKILIEEDEETKQIANTMFEPKDVDYYVTGLMVRTEGKLNY